MNGILEELQELRHEARREGGKPRYWRFSPWMADQVTAALHERNQLITFGELETGSDVLFGMGVAVDPYMDADIAISERANA